MRCVVHWSVEFFIDTLFIAVWCVIPSLVYVQTDWLGSDTKGCGLQAPYIIRGSGPVTSLMTSLELNFCINNNTLFQCFNSFVCVLSQIIFLVFVIMITDYRECAQNY